MSIGWCATVRRWFFCSYVKQSAPPYMDTVAGEPDRDVAAVRSVSETCSPESPWPYLSRAGLDPDRLVEGQEGTFHQLQDVPVGLCLELDALRQSKGESKAVLGSWLARLYGDNWPNPEPVVEALLYSFKKLKTSASRLKKSSSRQTWQRKK